MVEKHVLCSRITLCLLFAISGAFSVSLVRAPHSLASAWVKRGATQEIASAYFLGMKILNRIYNESLQEPNSPDYKKLYEEVVQVLNGVYACGNCATVKTYAGVGTMTFSNGSVIANSTLLYTTTFINEAVVKNLFLNSLRNNPSKDLIIDITYTSLKPPLPAPLPLPLTPTSQPTTIRSLSTQTISAHVSSTTLSTTTHNSRNTTSTSHPIHNITLHPTSSTEKPSSGTHSPVVTPSSRQPNTTEPHKGVTTNSSTGGGVPGWGIALLVLASVILLLLFVLLILMIWRWCCHRNERDSKKGAQMRTGNPYPHRKHSPQPSAPELTVPVDQAHQEDFEKLKKNRSGLYIVNH